MHFVWLCLSFTYGKKSVSYFELTEKKIPKQNFVDIITLIFTLLSHEHTVDCWLSKLQLTRMPNYSNPLPHKKRCFSMLSQKHSPDQYIVGSSNKSLKKGMKSRSRQQEDFCLSYLSLCELCVPLHSGTFHWGHWLLGKVDYCTCSLVHFI